jgi:hypothetical protein
MELLTNLWLEHPFIFGATFGVIIGIVQIIMKKKGN